MAAIATNMNSGLSVIHVRPKDEPIPVWRPGEAAENPDRSYLIGAQTLPDSEELRTTLAWGHLPVSYGSEMETQRYIRYAIIISIIAHSMCLVGFYVANQYLVILGMYISIIYFIFLLYKGKIPESMMLRTPGMDLDRRIFGPDPVPMFLLYMLTAPFFYSLLALDVLGSAVPLYSMFALAIIGQIILHLLWKKFASALFILALWLTVLAGALAFNGV